MSELDDSIAQLAKMGPSELAALDGDKYVTNYLYQRFAEVRRLTVEACARKLEGWPGEKMSLYAAARVVRALLPQERAEEKNG